MRKLLVAAALLAVALPLVAQETGKGALGQVGALGQEVKRAPLPSGPAPRLPDGTIDLNGLWVGGGPVGNVVTQGDELMEYICQENNQYGIAGGHPNPFAQ